jgi:hypothetical protein
MARVAIPVTKATRDGVTLTSTTGDPVNNHTVPNDGRTAVIVENSGSTVARTVTFRLSRKVDGFAVTPRTESLGVGERQLFGPFDVQEYGGQLQIDVDNAELKLTPIKISFGSRSITASLGRRSCSRLPKNWAGSIGRLGGSSRWHVAAG